MIVSVHIPKTAGSSFRHLLSERFGERLCLRYEQRPLLCRTEGTSPPPLRLSGEGDCAVVHGHFVADSVILPPDEPTHYAVWLRHPVERLVSHYLFWRREPFLDQPLCRRLLEEEMEVETFAAEEAMRDLQSFFLGAIPPDHFAFVGITERFGEGVARFNATFGTDLRGVAAVNVNPDKPERDYRALVGDRAYEQIAALNAKDMALYEYALAQYG
jgi:hypothetical protein